jgi:drug/metabolite transporter (DMT)-like permease
MLGIVAAGVCLGGIGGLLLKYGASRLPPTANLYEFLMATMLSLPVVAGVAFYVIPSLLWIQLLRTYDLSKVQPMLALTYVVTPIMAAMFLGETVSALRWAGIALIIVGVGVIAQS